MGGEYYICHKHDLQGMASYGECPKCVVEEGERQERYFESLPKEIQERLEFEREPIGLIRWGNWNPKTKRFEIDDPEHKFLYGKRLNYRSVIQGRFLPDSKENWPYATWKKRKQRVIQQRVNEIRKLRVK